MSGTGFTNFTLVSPVSIAITPTDELTRTSIQATYAGAWPPPTGYAFPQTNWIRWSVDLFNVHSQQTAARVYTQIPASGTGGTGHELPGDRFRLRFGEPTEQVGHARRDDRPHGLRRPQ